MSIKEFVNTSNMGIFALIAIFILAFIIFNHLKDQLKVVHKFNKNIEQDLVSYPNAEFAVISDLHYYDKSLGISGTAFQRCIESDRKLLKESINLLNLAIDNILQSKANFVLISGDLTKDGEQLCHKQIVKSLSRLVQNGIKVYIIPGNHDINNPLSCKYEKDKTLPIKTVTSTEFEDIYKDFGYGDAIYCDRNSLSYVVEPVNNLWLIGLDTCRYKENKLDKGGIIGGKIYKEQKQWLLSILKEANKKKKAVIVMQHHGLVEHWNGQSRLHPDYLVQDYKYLGKMMASHGVKIAFTGHYHAQNIALSDFGHDGYIYDVETGSLITSPCPIRYCSINNNKITIKSEKILEKLYPNTEFAKNAQEFTRRIVIKKAYNTLRKYYVPEKDSNYIADHLGYAFLAHYSGEANIENKPYFNESEIGIWGRIVYKLGKYIIDGLWEKLPPDNNNLVICLNKEINSSSEEIYDSELNLYKF